jgi:hypothetical protein
MLVKEKGSCQWKDLVHAWKRPFIVTYTPAQKGWQYHTCKHPITEL